MSEPFVIIRRTDEHTIETDVRLVFDDPFTFGMVLVDAARTIAEVFAREEGASLSEQYLKRIHDGFEAEYQKATTDIKLTTRPPG